MVALGPSLAESQDPTPEAILAARMREDRLPSLSVAVGRKGIVAYTGAMGLADIENSVPASAETVYRIGSVSKTITAIAVLQLAERERLDLDAPVQTYCASFPDKGARITPRLLLAHLGGIRDYDYRRFAEEFLSDRRYGSVREALAVFEGDPLAAEPGERAIYSSFGFNLLGCAVEGASGTSFGDYVATNIFKAAGMTQTRLDIPEEIVPHRSRPYSRAGDGSWQNSPFVDLSDRYPAGGLLSTPSDLVAFGVSLLSGGLLENETLVTMSERQRTRAGELVPYGLGWQLSEHAGELVHGGTSVGGSAYLHVRRNSGTVVALATNVDRWTESRRDLARALADWMEAR